LLSQGVVCQFHSIKVVALGKETHSKQRKATLTQLPLFLLNLYACPASSALADVYFSTQCLERSNIRNKLGADKAQEIALFQS